MSDGVGHRGGISHFGPDGHRSGVQAANRGVESLPRTTDDGNAARAPREEPVRGGQPDSTAGGGDASPL